MGEKVAVATADGPEENVVELAVPKEDPAEDNSIELCI